MVRVLERLKTYETLYENNKNDPNIKKRVSAKLPLFENMFKKLAKKRSSLTFENSFHNKTPNKKNDSIESTRLEGKDFFSDTKSFNDNISLAHSMQSLMKTVKSTQQKSFMINDSFEFCDQNKFDSKLYEIKNIIDKLNKAI